MVNSEDDACIGALHKAKDALTQIRSALIPFVKVLKEDSDRSRSEEDTSHNFTSSKRRIKPDSDETPKLDAGTRAEAEAAVACKYILKSG
jgi:hypothetical protein